MRSTLRAYAKLLRLPNVFTAVADPLAGWFLVGGGSPAWQLALLAGTSACLYTSGTVFNDCFDYRLDCREHPERPLPSGAISLGAAITLGVALMIVGLGLAMLAGPVRSEEHTSELQSLTNLVCRLLLEKKNMTTYNAQLSECGLLTGNDV